MFSSIAIILGKLAVFCIRLLKLGHGSTWPGHIALNVNKHFISDIIKQNPQLKIIFIAGTNGKTTTGKLIQTILEHSGKKVFQNDAGANLLNGIASSLLVHSSILCKINYDYAIFEIDENTVPLALKVILPDYIVLLNLFRDQLDRYGEVNSIALKWKNALEKVVPKTSLILNADDPQIAFLGQRTRSKTLYFGINDKKLATRTHQHAADSSHCPQCGHKLDYTTVYYSHLGIWECKKCQCQRPKKIFSTPPPCNLAGTYNLYNILAATLVTQKIGLSDDIINDSLKTFTPAFGRQEAMNVNGKTVRIFLSKNPTSFNESLRTIARLKAKNVLFVLNDRIPDGRDVSWIWDVDFEDYVEKFKQIIISGDRCYDIGLRIKYSLRSQKSKVKSQKYNSKFKIYEVLNDAINNSLNFLDKNETLYILPTYSAMLEVRKILTGRKIL